MKGLARKCFAEGVGTFIMVFAGTGAMIVNDVTHGKITHLGVSLVWGLVVMALIYALGEVSGAHFNPAVSLGFFMVRRFPGRRLPAYIGSQIAGALAASVALRLLFPEHATLGLTAPLGAASQAFAFETILTAILVLVILSVSSGAKEVGVVAALAIGGVIGLEAIFAGPICGASMNPARSLGPAVVVGNFSNLWIYLAGPVLGAMAGTGVWFGVRPAVIFRSPGSCP